MEPTMQDAIRENLSPETTALAAAYLQGATCKDAEAVQGVQWLCERMVAALGGPDAMTRISEELGL